MNGLHMHQLTNGLYIHKNVPHKYHFVDPITGMHTQNAESYNSKLKYKIKMVKGIKNECREVFLTKFLFFDEFKEHAFEKILE
ncbi:hypothetical protein H312_01160 [Anncaliia algerae PRA339]|uniref:Uncharacterized protein n=1 Tax=Anncaliia algerae PRA339 TaxID=1288291 RepID=A0A059F2I2_9MICR|nr:hypothetical protein H312_01160 [Anncaliia algerae PRA339]